MIMSDLISVIIPVYKAELHLPACVDSVLSQTYQNIEIILVDDGSPDACPEICDEYAALDSRIRVIHKENRGLSSARNAGIDVATGDYIAFLDSDDLWSPVFLERLYSALQETEADFAVCLFRRFSGDPPEIAHVPADAETLSREDAFECLFNLRNENMVVAPNKLYRRGLFKTIRYPEGQLHEDEAVIHHIIGEAEHVAWVDEELYLYRQTPGSITSGKFNIRRLDETKAKEDRIAYFESIARTDLADRTRVVYLSNLMRLYRTVRYELEDRNNSNRICDELHARFTEIYEKKLVADKSLLFQIRCCLFKYTPKTYSAFEYYRLERKLKNDQKDFS